MNNILKIQKKMLLQIRHSGDLLLSVSSEYQDQAEWEKQSKYWQRRYGFTLKWRYSLVQCKHVAVINGDIVETVPGKVYTFPAETVKMLDCDEVDRLLGESDE